MSIDINSIRIREKNNANLKINSLSKIIKRNIETIDRLKNINENVIFNKKQVDNLLNKNIEYEKELKDLEEQIKDINNGNYDDKFISEMEKTNSSIKKKLDDKNTKNIIIKKEQKDKEQTNLKKSYNFGNGYVKGEVNEREMDRALHKYCKDEDSIPDYIKNNLKEMPSNKGYIWKGIHCYGELPEEKGEPQIMFEKLRNGILRILEVHDKGDYRVYKRYEKQGKNKKTFISEQSFNKINFRKIL